VDGGVVGVVVDAGGVEGVVDGDVVCVVVVVEAEGVVRGVVGVVDGDVVGIVVIEARGVIGGVEGVVN